MADPLTFALVLLFLLQTKHLFADFYLQTPWMLRDTSVYLHPGRLAHAGLHGAGTFVALLLVGVPAGLALVVAVVDWAVHFHIDWGKGLWSARTGFAPHQAGYWRGFGFDQALHHWTYLAIAWVVAP